MRSVFGLRAASENGGIEGEPGEGAQNVDISAPRRLTSTLCAYSAHNVDMTGRSADFSTFCALRPASPQCEPLTLNRRNRSAFATTDTLESAIARLASTGLSSPAAASGIAATL